MELDILVGQGKREVFVNVDSNDFTINALGELRINPALLVMLASVPPIGTLLDYTSEVMPSVGDWMIADGSSLLRANYPALRDLYIVSRGVVTITEANPGVVTLNGHGFNTASCISLATTGTLPTNLAININYYVIYVNANTFRLAASADLARAGTAINTTGAIQAGVHTLYSNPHGINGANSFYIPNTSGIITKHTGSQNVNGRTKTGPALGAVEEDQMQGWQVGATADDSGAQNYWGIATIRNVTASSSALANNTKSNYNTTAQGDAKRLKAMNDGTNGDPRTGATTRENSMGVHKILRVR